jgi:hypothetical protein
LQGGIFLSPNLSFGWCCCDVSDRNGVGLPASSSMHSSKKSTFRFSLAAAAALLPLPPPCDQSRSEECVRWDDESEQTKRSANIVGE